MRRRRFVAAAGALLAAPWAGAQSGRATYPVVRPGLRLEFPRDDGAHLEYRTEWWYITGWLAADGAPPFGFQVTFFRARPPFDTDNPSRFALRQALFAHAAIADPRVGHLVYDQRAARAALGLAGAAMGRTEVWIDDWRLEARETGWQAEIPARDFHLNLDFAQRAPVLPEGEDGYSRKGPRPEEASYYYSRPQLAVAGRLARGGAGGEVRGSAWFDHEWSSAYLPPEAAGWDWIGINLEDGGALMAFRMRARSGGVVWASATLRAAGGQLRTYAPGEVDFAPLRGWRSPRTGVAYPVAMRVRTGDEEWRVEPLMDDQELDARLSTGNVYWEGAVRVTRAGAPGGRGYLELTGYGRPLEL